jgi:hypothetical protein
MQSLRLEILIGRESGTQEFVSLSYKRLHHQIVEAQLLRTCSHKVPAGDPNCPPHICNVKHIYNKILLPSDRSTGGLEDGGDLNNERDDEFEGDNNKRDGEYKDDDDDEGGMVESNSNSFSFSAD